MDIHIFGPKNRKNSNVQLVDPNTPGNINAHDKWNP